MNRSLRKKMHSKKFRIFLHFFAAFAVINKPSLAFSAKPYWFRILVPNNLVPSQIGQAIFREGNNEYIVLAASLPVKKFALRQVTGIPDASVLHLPDATVLQIPLPLGHDITSTAGDSSFHVDITKSTISKAMPVSFNKGAINLKCDRSAAVVSMSDPSTGRPLLVGTVLGAGSIKSNLSGPGYRFIPASRGIAVVASSDAITLSPEPSGFVLQAMQPEAKLPIGNPFVKPPLTEVSDTPNGLNLPQYSIIGLRQRLGIERIAVAEAPPLDRREATFRLARVMLALDMGPEAGAALDRLAQSQPYVVQNAQWQLLHAVSDIVSHHPNKAQKHLQNLPKDEDQANFWRGVADAEIYNNHDAGNILRQYVNTLSALPVALKNQITPIVAESLVRSNKFHALERLFKIFPNEKNIQLEKAELQEKLGNSKDALLDYSNIIKSRNYRDAAIAFSHMVMLEYKLHKIDAKSAASLLLHHIYDWRGEHHELSLRLQVAQLQADYGAWPEAMAGLNRALILFPTEADSINKLRIKLFATLGNNHLFDKMSPLAAAALIEDNMDLIPSSTIAIPTLNILSRKLAELGLSNPAKVITDTAIKTMSNNHQLNTILVDLARLQIKNKNLDAAKYILDKITKNRYFSENKRNIDDLYKKIATYNTIEESKKRISKNNDKSILIGENKNNNFSSEEGSLSRLTKIQIPKIGELNKANVQVVMKLAIAASKMHNLPLLKKIRDNYINRIPPGPQSALLMVITNPPLSKTANLKEALSQIRVLENAAEK
jgi:hypothetical protein